MTHRVTPPVTRRDALRLGALSGAALLVPTVTTGAPASGAAASSAGAFRHGVASGDPRPDGVLLWTRVTSSEDASPGPGRRPGRRRPVAGGARRRLPRGRRQGHLGYRPGPGPHRPGRRPRLRFRDRLLVPVLPRLVPVAGRPDPHRPGRPRRSQPPTARRGVLRQLPGRPLQRVPPPGRARRPRRGAAPGGLHLRVRPGPIPGPRPRGPAARPGAGVDHPRGLPAGARAVQVRPDLQALHSAAPWIVTWDDHESANDAWRHGAENHTEGAEGTWADRRAAALQAYREWMPIRMTPGEPMYRRLRFGRLAELSMLDLRSYRSQQVTQDHLASVDDPARTITGDAQMSWPAPERSCRSWPRCSVISTSSAVSSACLVSPVSSPPGPVSWTPLVRAASSPVDPPARTGGMPVPTRPTRSAVLA